MHKVLLVEDNAVFRGLLKEALEGRFPRMEIVEAPNAEFALRKVDSSPPDLMLLDIEMPGQSGLDLARTVRSTYPSIAVVFLTSYDLPEYRKAAKELNAVEFLSKGSTTMEQIVRLVESLLPERHAEVTDGDPA